MSFASKRASREAKNRSYIPKEERQPKSPDPLSSISPMEQDGDRDLYADLPDSIEIRRDEIRGRGIWCKKIIKRGSIILARQPYVTALGRQSLSLYCSYCTKPSSDSFKLKRCANCKTIWYCSSTCQNNDWKFHKHECPALKHWVTSAPGGAPPSETLRSLARILWGRKMQGEESIWWRELKALKSHRTSLSPSKMVSHTQLAQALIVYLQATSPSQLEPFGIHSPSDLVDLISQYSINTFTLPAPTLSPLGACVSPIAALLNHSCQPNAVIVFPHLPSPTEPSPSVLPQLNVVAIKDIHEDEEIFTAYIDTSLPTSLRQQSLKETYNFTCTCQLCTYAGPDIDPREALWCPNSCGGMSPSSKGTQGSTPRCSTCRAEFSASQLDDIEEKLRIGREALDKAAELQFSDPTKALHITSHILPLLSALIPPSAHPILALRQIHQTLLIKPLSTNTETSVLDDAIRSSAHRVTGLLSVFEEGHPSRAIGIVELGKLLAIDEPHIVISQYIGRFPPSGLARLVLAVEVLKRALNELMIGFGESNDGGDVGREVRNDILSLEREMHVYMRSITRK